MIEANGTYRGLTCALLGRLHDTADRACVRVVVRRGRGRWLFLGDHFYRGSAHITFVSEVGGWAPGSWDQLGPALEECYQAVMKPHTAEEAGLV